MISIITVSIKIIIVPNHYSTPERLVVPEILYGKLWVRFPTKKQLRFPHTKFGARLRFPKTFPWENN